jgi:hypothetical protein
MIRYLCYLPFFILMRLATFPLAPIAVAFQHGNRLPKIFRWLETWDNDLTGDDGWKMEHCNGNYDNYCCRVLWLFRNGGGVASYTLFGRPYLTPAFWSVKDTPGLQWRFGWDTQDEKQGRCKYNLTVRYRK